MLTGIIVLVFFMARYLLTPVQESPFLLFLPAIVIASFVFDRGTGFFATLLSTALAIYFFIAPSDRFSLQDIGSVVAVLVFLGVGLFTAAVIEALRGAIEALVANETVLDNSLSLLETVIESMPDPIFAKDREGRFVRINAALGRLWGVTSDAARGRRDRDFLPPHLAAAIEAVDQEVMQKRLPMVIEEVVDVAGVGRRVFLSTKAPWLNPKGEIVGLIGISRDIDERRKIEADIRSAHAQKEILLEDINHRVKNHLQSVMALLSMSKRRVPDPMAQEELGNAVGRLGVLVKAYDRLRVKNSADAAVEMKEYLQGLCDEVAPALIGLRPVVIRTHLDEAEVDAGQAVSIGLALNELLQNCLKYAFPNDRAGSITVTFRNASPHLLEVVDDGIGMQLGEANGTGVRLVRALAAQLGGSVTWESENGVRVRLEWPKAGA